MKIHVIETGLFKLDGGAMFGVVPRTMWQKLNPPDENNLCTWAMRCLLVETDNRRILIDCGMGDKQDAKFRSHFHPHGQDTLLNSLQSKGFSADDITDVFLTHLHFDHCGGALRYDASGAIVPTFQKATYWSNKKHYDWAFTPNAREAASFLKENFVPLKEQGVLQFVDLQENLELFKGFNIGFVYGHTEAMMLPQLHIGDKTIIYCADLMPSEHHIGLPYVMGYDMRPLDTMAEKEHYLNQAVEVGNTIFFYEHSPSAECATVRRREDGRLILDKAGLLQDFLNA